MTWVKMDDRYPDHPKVAGLTDGAFRLWCTGIAYCSRHLSDGMIPEPVITRWGVKHPDRAAAELVSGGLWRSSANGYEVVNYLKYQRSEAQIEEIKAKRSKAGKAGARAKQDAKQTASNDAATCLDGAETGASPDTESDTETEPSSSSSVTASPARTDDDDVWIEYAHLAAAANPNPVGNFARWSAKVIADAQERFGHDLDTARTRTPDATPEQLARFLFDGTEPPRPRVFWCSDCQDNHAGACDLIPADLIPASPYPQEERG